MNPSVKIHPVISAVPTSAIELKGREKVAALGRCARDALKHSAAISQLALGPLEKKSNGAPVPCKGVHWSLTHKERYVAAVCAPFAVGIDIEKIKPFNEKLYLRIADEREWALAPEMTEPLFFRYWTAKEAVLKAMGVGMVGLSQCRIKTIVDHNNLKLTYADTPWTVSQYWGPNDHIVAVTANGVNVEWHPMEKLDSV